MIRADLSAGAVTVVAFGFAVRGLQREAKQVQQC
jgi:hypothetical protein